MAQLTSGCVCLCTEDFVEYSCPDYTNYPKCKENCPFPQKKCLSLKNSKGKQGSTDGMPHTSKRSGKNEDKSYVEFPEKENNAHFQEAEFENLKEGYKPVNTEKMIEWACSKQF